MINVKQFIEQCQEVIAEYEAGGQSLNDAAAKINASPFDYPFTSIAHPMIYKVAEIAFDIAENYRSEKEDKADWKILTKTLDNYIKGNWEPTCWILSAAYGEDHNGKLAHSYSMSVRRQNGKTLIETASPEIKNEITANIKKLNNEQADERYLQNLARILPTNIDKYKLISVEVREYLTEPYYSTSIA
jgi:hypothetical protein